MFRLPEIKTIFGGMRKRAFVFLLTISMSVCSPSMALAASANSIADYLGEVEKLAGVQADPSTPILDRLTTVEIKVLGAPQSGALVGRIGRLRYELNKRGAQRTTAPPPSPPRMSVSANDASEINETIPGGGSSLSDNLPLLNALPPNFLRIEAPDAMTEAEADYMAAVVKGSKGKTLRFKSMPVPVFINQFPDRQFVSCVVKGFEVWEDRTDGGVRFVQVDDPSKARIQVAWKRLGSAEDKSGCTLGAHTITKYTSNGHGSVSLLNVSGVPVPVYIPKFGPKYTVPPQVIEVNLDLIMSKTPNVRYRLLQNVVTHELGHALGLLGHSPNINDMMYRVTDEHSRLSQRDINTLLRLYKEKVDVPL